MSEIIAKEAIHYQLSNSSKLCGVSISCEMGEPDDQFFQIDTWQDGDCTGLPLTQSMKMTRYEFDILIELVKKIKKSKFMKENTEC